MTSELHSPAEIVPSTNGIEPLSPPAEKLTDVEESAKPETMGASPISSADPPAEPRTSVDREAEQMVISSLRAQVQDLFSQVTQLNGKLVKSYDRVSDLEDDLHVASQNLRHSALKIAELEMERTQHLAALNTGLLVEKSQVTTELTRLMERATDEAARRGRAESARQEIEKDLDDLSAGLFNQANIMVAQARYSQATSERKLDEAQQALKSAEEAVGIMQHQMQSMQEEKEKALVQVEQMHIRMGKGKWIERDATAPSATAEVRLLSSHNPYQEFLLFIAHLRSLRPTTTQPPAMSTLLSLAFLARLQTEDSDPTVRLDLAPSLNWLSRRSVLAAIHSGELTVEPMAAATLVQELMNTTSSMIPGNISNTHNISCALCGTAIFPTHQSSPISPISPRPPLHPSISRSTSGSWPTNLFKNPLASANTGGNPTSPPTHNTSLYQERPYPTQVYIFRVTSSQVTTSTAPVVGQAVQSRNLYPLCASGWCLARIRTTCSLWAFVRTIIVERIWEEEPLTLNLPVPKRTSSRETLRNLTNTTSSGSADKTGAPSPTKATMSRMPSLGGLWGKASSAISAGVEKVQARAAEATTKDKAHLPLTPPHASHAVDSTAAVSPTGPVHRVLPPPPPPKATTPAAPPPLPSRSANRSQNGPVSPVSQPIQEETVAPITDATEAVTSEPPAKNDIITTPTQDDKTADEPTLSSNPIEIPLPESATPSPAPLAPELPTPVSPVSPVVPLRAKSPVAPPSRTASPTPRSRAGSPVPTKVPSRTGSPVPVRPSSRTGSSAPVRPPSRTASPAPSSPGGPPPPPPRAAARTSSPAIPPPLPRRAAGRAPRPVSLIEQAASNAAASAAQPPAPIPEAMTEPKDEDGKAEDTKDADGKIEDGTAEDDKVEGAGTEGGKTEDAKSKEDVKPTITTAEEETGNESLLAEHAIQEPTAVPEVKPSVSQAGEQPQDQVEASPATSLTLEGDKAIARDLKSEGGAAATVSEDQSQTGLVDAKNNDPTVAKDDQVDSSLISDEPVTKVEDNSNEPESLAKEEKENDNTEVYVGETTWEERTWKELTRLREDMFWARVGGVR